MSLSFRRSFRRPLRVPLRANALSVAPAPVPPIPSEDAPAPTPYSGRRRLDYIDTLRGLAALWVLFFHYLGAYRNGGISTTNPVTGLFVRTSHFGQLAVNLFLVISGFCLFYPLIRRALAASSSAPGDGRKAPIVVPFLPFMARRARRILPPYWALLTLQALLTLGGTVYRDAWPPFLNIAYFIHTAPRIDPPDLAAHYLLLHNLLARYVASISLPFWSIALEWQLYLVFPLLVGLRNRWGFRGLLLTSVLLSFTWQVVYFRLHPHFSLAAEGAYRYAVRDLWSLPVRLPEFVLGMAAAYVVARGEARWGRLALAGFLLLLPAGVWWYARWGLEGFGPCVNTGWGLIFALLIVALDYLTRARPHCLRLLRPVTVVGLFSYSLYLLHSPILNAFSSYLMAQQGQTMTQRLLWTLFVALPLNLAYAFLWYWLFERPILLATQPARDSARTSGTAP